MIISRLHCHVTAVRPDTVEVHVGNGVFIELRVPIRPEEAAWKEGPMTIYVDHRFPMNQPPAMFGFLTEEEKALFRLMIDKVDGLGPSIALKVLASMPAGQFKAAVVAGDTKMVTTVKGVGPNMAKKIIFGLREKLEKDGSVEAWKDQVAGLSSPAAADAELALVALGYKAKDVKVLVKSIVTDKPDADVDFIIRAALQRANR